MWSFCFGGDSLFCNRDLLKLENLTVKNRYENTYSLLIDVQNNTNYWVLIRFSAYILIFRVVCQKQKQAETSITYELCRKLYV